MQKQLSEMLWIATCAHHRQFDKGGAPYILHPLHVMNMLRQSHPDDYELQMIGLGHDLFEDTYVNRDLLLDQGFSYRVVDGISCMTKVDGESFEDYKLKVMSNLDSMLVKREDLRHNSCLTRLKGVTDKDLERAGKYMRFYHELGIAIKAFKV